MTQRPWAFLFPAKMISWRNPIFESVGFVPFIFLQDKVEGRKVSGLGEDGTPVYAVRMI